MSTGTTIALVGGAAVVIYLLTRRTTTVPTTTINPGMVSVANPTNTLISSGASIANNLINSIFS